jgi:hypothetical protein
LFLSSKRGSFARKREKQYFSVFMPICILVELVISSEIWPFILYVQSWLYRVCIYQKYSSKILLRQLGPEKTIGDVAVIHCDAFWYSWSCICNQVKFNVHSFRLLTVLITW